MPQDPTTKHEKPTFPQSQIDPPGTEAEMTPTADHGEQSYVGSGKLNGLATIITGGDSGIGKAVAIAYAREGCDVLVTHLPEEAKDAQDTKQYVEAAGRKCVLMAVDLGTEPACKQVVEAAVKAFGRLDVLVNNAAMQRTHEAIDEFSAEEWEATFRTNIHSFFYLAKAAVPHMKPGSSIINTSSIQAYQPSPNLLAYAATKGAIVNFTKGLSALLADQGIRVNSVAPGPVWTPLIPSTMPSSKVKTFGKDTPTGRPAQPAELAGAYVFLASEQASYINAAVIPVTGGKPTM